MKGDFMDCEKCRFKDNNGTPCLVPCFNLNIPPENCRFFQVKKKKRAVEKTKGRAMSNVLLLMSDEHNPLYRWAFRAGAVSRRLRVNRSGDILDEWGIVDHL